MANCGCAEFVQIFFFKWDVWEGVFLVHQFHLRNQPSQIHPVQGDIWIFERNASLFVLQGAESFLTSSIPRSLSGSGL